MAFVYIHIVWFSCWIVPRRRALPVGLLTLIVSLEAIFLSTFVMISQNRADAKRRLIADQQWQTVQAENEQNEELLGLSRQILELTKAIRASRRGDGPSSSTTKKRSGADGGLPLPSRFGAGSPMASWQQQSPARQWLGIALREVRRRSTKGVAMTITPTEQKTTRWTVDAEEHPSISPSRRSGA